MNLINYFKEVKVELAKVSWPTRAEATHLTIVIIVSSLAVGLYIGGLDLGFTTLLGMFIN
jgi:preprotein translocase subunit SecE